MYHRDSECSTAVDDSTVFYDTGDIPLDSPIYDDRETCESLDGTGTGGQKTNAYAWGSCLKGSNNDNYYYDENDCTKQGTWGHCKITLPNENDILLRDYHTSVSSDSPLYNDRAHVKVLIHKAVTVKNVVTITYGLIIVIQETN